MLYHMQDHTSSHIPERGGGGLVMKDAISTVKFFSRLMCDFGSEDTQHFF